jgi:uncharacterized SAM-binding protein YcdF (DUF218 family)
VTLLATISRRRKLLLSFALVCLVTLAAYTFIHLGRFLAREDPLQQADAIFVFAGRYVERPLEAADLFKSGYAPRIVVTRATVDQATFELERRRVRIPTEHDLTADILRQLEVPADALISPAFVHDNTGEEARTLGELARARGWRRVIVVSSKYHLRRIRLAVAHYLAGTGVEVIARGSRYDQSTPERWWTRRSDIRTLAAEVPKLVAYALGIGL